MGRRVSSSSNNHNLGHTNRASTWYCALTRASTSRTRSPSHVGRCGRYAATGSTPASCRDQHRDRRDQRPRDQSSVRVVAGTSVARRPSPSPPFGHPAPATASTTATTARPDAAELIAECRLGDETSEIERTPMTEHDSDTEDDHPQRSRQQDRRHPTRTDPLAELGDDPDHAGRIGSSKAAHHGRCPCSSRDALRPQRSRGQP